MNRKRKILAGALTAILLLATLSIPAFATSGDVAGAVEQTWTSAQGQIKTVVNNVVFPVLDVILAVLFFVKVGGQHLGYRKRKRQNRSHSANSGRPVSSLARIRWVRSEQKEKINHPPILY